MKIYIAGPITRTPDFVTRFEDAKRAIEKKGHEAVNPVDIRLIVQTEGPGAITYRQIMNICKSLIGACDAIYLMQDWQRSNGARQEHKAAIDNGLKFYASLDAIPETAAAKEERTRKYRQEG